MILLWPLFCGRPSTRFPFKCCDCLHLHFSYLLFPLWGTSKSNLAQLSIFPKFLASLILLPSCHPIQRCDSAPWRHRLSLRTWCRRCCRARLVGPPSRLVWSASPPMPHRPRLVTQDLHGLAKSHSNKAWAQPQNVTKNKKNGIHLLHHVTTCYNIMIYHNTHNTIKCFSPLYLGQCFLLGLQESVQDAHIVQVPHLPRDIEVSMRMV